MKFVRKSISYIALMLLVSALALLFEFLSGLAPQEQVAANIAASMEQLKSEGLAPGVLYEGHPRSKLDNLSENYILTYSYYMDTRRDPASILTNPGRQIQDPYGELFLQTEELLKEQRPADTNYVRYWMGFRMYVRPLLSIMNYMDARQCIQWGFFLLMGAVTIVLYRQTRSVLLTLAFPAAISQLNPLVVASCFQYSACFYLAFIGMLLVPRVRGKRFTVPMLFLVLGMLTQIFDFFTAPLLTFGLPMLMLLLCPCMRESRAKTLLYALCRCLGTWSLGYVGAWLIKMFLTSVFTPLAGLADGFGRLAFWISGADMAPDLLLPAKAIFYCLINIVDAVPLMVEGVILLLYLLRILKRRPGKAVFRQNLAVLAVTFLPFVWFIMAAKPSYEQFYFQYRSLGIFLFGGLVFLIKTAGWDQLFREPDQYPVLSI